MTRQGSEGLGAESALIALAALSCKTVLAAIAARTSKPAEDSSKVWAGMIVRSWVQTSPSSAKP